MAGRRLVASLVLIAAVGLTAGVPPATAGGAPCALDQVPRDGWYRVPPPGPGAWSVGAVGDDPCTLVAASPGGTVARSGDAGATWTTVVRDAGALGPVLSEGLGSTVLVGVAASNAVLVSTDGGEHFATRSIGPGVAGIAGVPGDVVAATARTGTLLVAWLPRPAGVAVRPPTLYTSVEGGVAFVPLRGSTSLAPVAVAYDTDSDAIFVASDQPSPDGGVWRSADGGGTFQQAVALGGTTTDVNVTPLPGGGRVVYAASTAGVWDSVDGGSGWGRGTSRPVRALRPEYGQPGVVTMLVGSPPRPGRSTDAAATTLPNDAGLPGDCAGRTLTRTSGVPSSYLLGCADGRAYRYRSSGTDLPGARPPAGGPAGSDGSGGSGGGGLDPLPGTRTVMRPLRAWPLLDGGPESGTLAFDGSVLYYTDGYASAGNVVDRIDARTGQSLPSFTTGAQIIALDVDRDARTLFVETFRGMYQSPLDGGAPSLLFRFERAEPPGLVQYSWDASLHAFWTFAHNGNAIYLVSRDGTLLSRCWWEQPTYQTTEVTDPTSHTLGASAIAAAGDGTAYVQMEDDTTVLRISRTCAVIGTFVHPAHSEVLGEDDSMVCDTSTFPQSAVWLRDGGTMTVTAYEIPGAYCPLATRIEVSVPSRLPVAARSSACARLTLPWGPPVAGEDVALFADSMPLGDGVTDPAGRICLPYVPSVHHRPGVPPTGRKPVQAVFLGTRSFRASAGVESLEVLGVPAGLGPVTKAAVPPAPEAQPPLAQPGPQPAPHLQAGVRQAQTQAQAQAQAQAHAQPVAQANPNPNPAAVLQHQEQPQLAGVVVGTEPAIETEHAMVPRRRSVPSPAPFWLAASALTAAAAFRLAYQPSYRRIRPG